MAHSEQTYTKTCREWSAVIDKIERNAPDDESYFGTLDEIDGACDGKPLDERVTIDLSAASCRVERWMDLPQ